MKLNMGSTKLKVLFLSLASIAIYAKSIIDRSAYSTAFMNDDEIKFEKSFEDIQGDRIIASYESREAKIQYIPNNEENTKRINGLWELTRVLDINENETYNKAKSNKELLVNLELIGTSLIRINRDETLLFDISFLTPQNTMVLFRTYKDGYEILEAKRIKPLSSNDQVLAEAKVEEKIEEVKEEVVQRKQGPFEKDMNLTFERGLVPNLSKDISKGDTADGYIEVRAGAIESLEATMFLGSNSEKTYVCDPTKIIDGGVFKTFCNGEEVGGIITPNGNDAVRVRFNNGALSGAMFNFTTLDEKQNIMDKDAEQFEKDRERRERMEAEQLAKQEEAEYEAQIKAEEAEAAQEEASFQRAEAAGISEDEFYEDGEERVEAPKNEAQVARIIASEGFKF